MSENVIRRNLSCGYYLGSGNAEGHYSVVWENIKDAHLLFYYHTKAECYIVWNADILKRVGRTSETANFVFGTSIKRRLAKGTIDEISTFTKIIKINYSDYYENVVVVPRTGLVEFCQNYELYIFPTDEQLKKGRFLYALQNSSEKIVLDSPEVKYQTIARERDCVSKIRRNPRFRKIVLEKYNYTCLICGCREENILEAAHIIAVAQGGDDNPENGFCLCRNHHRLYDSGLLDIDLQSNTFKCYSESEKEMTWYKEAKERNLRCIYAKKEE